MQYDSYDRKVEILCERITGFLIFSHLVAMFFLIVLAAYWKQEIQA